MPQGDSVLAELRELRPITRNRIVPRECERIMLRDQSGNSPEIHRPRLITDGYVT
jgi:hypothetical protein